MNLPDIHIEHTEDAAELAVQLESRLLDTLRSALPQAVNSQLVLAARNREQHLLGGLVGSTSYGWLHVHILWVQDESRGTGIGTALMREAEAKAVTLGCHSAWLDTSSHGAMQFYRSLDYEPFGMLSNSESQSPADHHRWFLKKALQVR